MKKGAAYVLIFHRRASVHVRSAVPTLQAGREAPSVAVVLVELSPALAEPIVERAHGARAAWPPPTPPLLFAPADRLALCNSWLHVAVALPEIRTARTSILDAAPNRRRTDFDDPGGSTD